MHYFSFITEVKDVYYMHYTIAQQALDVINDNPDGQKICVRKYRVQQLGNGSKNPFNFPIGTYKPYSITLYF